MIKYALAAVTLFCLAGCPAHTDVKSTLNALGINELNCGKAAIANEMPTVEETVASLLGMNSPSGQALLDALFRQAPELIACTVQNLTNAVTHPVVGAQLKPMIAMHAADISTNGKAALTRWGVK